MSQMKLPPRSGTPHRRDASHASEEGGQKRAQKSRSMSGVHKAVSAAPLKQKSEWADARQTPAADDGWNWEAPPAAVTPPPEPARQSWDQGEVAPSDAPDLFDDGAQTLASEVDRLRRLAVSGSERSKKASRYEERSERGARRQKQKPSLAQAGTVQLDAPDYGDEDDGLGDDLAMLPSPASKRRGSDREVPLSRKATPPLDLSAVSPRAATPPLGVQAIEGSGSSFARAATPPLGVPVVSSRAATPPLGVSAVSPRATTQAIDGSGSSFARAATPPLGVPAVDDDLSTSDMTGAEPSLNKYEAGVNLEIPENASMGVIIVTLLKQVFFFVVVCLQKIFRPIRDSLDRYYQRKHNISEERDAALTIQQKRLSKIIAGAVGLFLVCSVGGMIYSLTKEKMPPEAVVKLLYPWGLMDGTFNGRPIAGVQSVDIEYIQREPCLEHETEPHCYAYQYTAHKLEGFEGKMLIGINHQGQWQLFNPPKELVAAAQAKANKKKRRR